MTFNGKPWKIIKRAIFDFKNFLIQKFSSYIFQLMQFFLCRGLYRLPPKSKLQISAYFKYNISSTSSVEYRCLWIRGLLTLERRFLRADLIEVFKILGGFENLDPDRFFSGDWRWCSLKLFKKRYRLDVRKFKFAHGLSGVEQVGDGIVRFRNVDLNYFIF